MNPLVLLFVLILLLSGCDQQAPEAGPAIAEPAIANDAEIQAVIDAFPQGVEATAQAIERIPDPVKQVVAVTRLADSGALLTAELCAQLRSRPPRERCKRFARRPHLNQEDLSEPVRDRDRPAPGPPAALLAPRRAVQSTLAGAGASEISCGETDELDCRTDHARAAAADGRITDAAAHCMGIKSQRWREECSFEAAEEAATLGGAKGPRAMAELCLLSGPFRARCLQHGVRLVALQAPDANASPDAWAPLLETASELSSFWADRDPTFGDWQRQRLWSYALYHAYAHTPVVTGAPLAALPADAVPHVRAAAAWRLLTGPNPPEGDLAALSQALEQALATRQGPTAPPEPRRQIHPLDPRWSIDGRGEDEQIPATFYLGSSRRAVSEDEAVDRLLCLVEALGRAEPLRPALLDEARQHPNPLVNWTAERVQRWYAPGAPGGGMREQAPSTMPMARPGAGKQKGQKPG